MNRTLDKLWVWFGILAGALPYWGIAHPPSINLEILSIFFGGLLAIGSILPATTTYKKMKEISHTGHINDLVHYIALPLWCSFILLVVDLVKVSSAVPLPQQIPFWLMDGVLLAVWGVFILSLLRLLLLFPHLLTDRQESEE